MIYSDNWSFMFIQLFVQKLFYFAKKKKKKKKTTKNFDHTIFDHVRKEKQYQ